LFATPIVATVLEPIAIRPVKPTSLTAYEPGGTKKSPVLTAVPYGVDTEMLPDPVFEGTAVVMIALVAAVTTERLVVNATTSFAIVV
jgi:hypothetical protein